MIYSTIWKLFLIGILAAIAIPNFISYRNRAYQAAVKSELQNLLVAAEAYFAEHNKYSINLRDLNFASVMSSVTFEIISADEKCFEAKGIHSQLQESILIDCIGMK